MTDRFRVIDKPVYATELINNTPDGPVFDLGIELEMYHGPVYIKVEHIREMATKIGMVNKTNLSAVERENKLLKEEIESLREAKEFLDNVRKLVSRTGRTPSRGPRANPVENSVSNKGKPAGNLNNGSGNKPDFL